LLPEVGDEGQARLAASVAVVPRDGGQEVALEYLRRAGVEKVRVEDPRAAVFPHAEHFVSPEARGIAQGAWTALVHIRRTLT
jgi:hypothetical protein